MTDRTKVVRVRDYGAVGDARVVLVPLARIEISRVTFADVPASVALEQNRGGSDEDIPGASF